MKSETQTVVGIFLLTHGNLGEALIDVATRILGKEFESLDFLGVKDDLSPDVTIKLAKKIIKKIETGNGVLILTDIVGATPCNITKNLLVPRKVEAVSGLNLSMLLRAMNYREQNIESLVSKTLSGGISGIQRVHTN